MTVIPRKFTSSSSKFEGDLLHQTESTRKSHFTPIFLGVFVCMKVSPYKLCTQFAAIKLWEVAVGLNVTIEVYGK